MFWNTYFNSWNLVSLEDIEFINMIMRKIISKIITCLLYLMLGVVASLLSLGLFLSYLEGDMSRNLLEVLK